MFLLVPKTQPVLTIGVSVGTISLSDGLFLRANPNTTVEFPDSPQLVVVPNRITGGFMSTLDSWGPTNELGFYPHIAAPGGDIFSTLPLALGGFGVLSGTSMSAPYISGVAALYMSGGNVTDPLQLRGLLSSTAIPVDFNDGVKTFNNLQAPRIQQGAGLIQADKALQATTLVSPSFLTLNVKYLIFNLTAGHCPSSREPDNYHYK